MSISSVPAAADIKKCRQSDADNQQAEMYLRVLKGSDHALKPCHDLDRGLRAVHEDINRIRANTANDAGSAVRIEPPDSHEITQEFDLEADATDAYPAMDTMIEIEPEFDGGRDTIPEISGITLISAEEPPIERDEEGNRVFNIDDPWYEGTQD